MLYFWNEDRLCCHVTRSRAQIGIICVCPWERGSFVLSRDPSTCSNRDHLCLSMRNRIDCVVTWPDHVFKSGSFVSVHEKEDRLCCHVTQARVQIGIVCVCPWERWLFVLACGMYKYQYYSQFKPSLLIDKLFITCLLEGARPGVEGARPG